MGRHLLELLTEGKPSAKHEAHRVTTDLTATSDQGEFRTRKAQSTKITRLLSQHALMPCPYFGPLRDALMSGPMQGHNLGPAPHVALCCTVACSGTMLSASSGIMLSM